MNTKSQIKPLSDDDLVAIVGGMKNWDTQAYQLVWNGLINTCGPEGQKVLANSLTKALGIL